VVIAGNAKLFPESRNATLSISLTAFYRKAIPANGLSAHQFEREKQNKTLPYGP
jgi:hypothetical protein